jgi:hypothetical protein
MFDEEFSMLASISDNAIPVIAIIAVFSFLTLTSLIHYAHKAFCFAQLTRLKERLLDAGMTSAEIERIVNAGTKDIEAEIQQKAIKKTA